MTLKRNYHGLSESGVFYRDRDEWMRYVQGRTDMEVSVRLIGCYLALKMNPVSPEAFPMQTTMATELGVSLATVKRAIAQLLAFQLMRVRLVSVRRGKRPVNHYSLIHPANLGVTDDP